MTRKKKDLPPWTEAEKKMNDAVAALKKAKTDYYDSLWTEEACAWRATKKLWLCSDGKEMKYSAMTNDHLLNAISSLTQLRPTNPAIATLRKELDDRINMKCDFKDMDKLAAVTKGLQEARNGLFAHAPDGM